MSRLHCESESFKMDLILDVNTQIYPVDLGKFADVSYISTVLLAQWEVGQILMVSEWICWRLLEITLLIYWGGGGGVVLIYTGFEVRGKVMFSVCLSVHVGGGGVTPWSLVLSWKRLGLPPVRTFSQGVPLDRTMGWPPHPLPARADRVDCGQFASCGHAGGLSC